MDFLPQKPEGDMPAAVINDHEPGLSDPFFSRKQCFALEWRKIAITVKFSGRKVISEIKNFCHKRQQLVRAMDGRIHYILSTAVYLTVI